MAVPHDQLIALRRQNAQAEAASPVATSVDLANINFRYAIEVTVRRGDRCASTTMVFIEFPRGIG